METIIESLKGRPKILKGMKPYHVTKSRDYIYTKIEFYVHEFDLYIRLSGHNSARWAVIKDFSQYNAVQVFTSADLGRHFEDGVTTVWHDYGLELGWTKPILHPLVPSNGRPFPTPVYKPAPKTVGVANESSPIQVMPTTISEKDEDDFEDWELVI